MSTGSNYDNQISASYGGGGCCGGGGGSGGLSTGEALTFLAALAFAVAFLNSQITMLLGKKRRRRKRTLISEFEGTELRNFANSHKRWNNNRLQGLMALS